MIITLNIPYIHIKTESVRCLISSLFQRRNAAQVIQNQEVQTYTQAEKQTTTTTTTVNTYRRNDAMILCEETKTQQEANQEQHRTDEHNEITKQ